MATRKLGIILTGLLAVTTAERLGAQGEKLTLKTTPAPNQAIRIAVMQNMSFNAESAAMPGPMKIEVAMGFQGLQRVGAPDGHGNLVAEFTIDSTTLSMTMNGSAMPVPPAMDSLRGRTFTVTYDSSGKVTDVKAAGQPEPLLNSVKGMLGQLGNAPPSVTLGIGDTVSVPLKMELPMPGLTMSNQATTLEGLNTFKLTGITRDGSDRIALLELKTAGSMSGDITMQMTGTGTLQWNVDKGFLKQGNNELKTDMTMMMPGGTMHMNGTVHIVITGESRAP